MSATSLRFLVAAIALSWLAPLPGHADVVAIASIPCASSQGGSGVTIQSCSYALQASPAGNPKYFVIVTISYAAPTATAAVRFRCVLGNGSTSVAQYGVLRQSGTALTFISPFVSSSSGLKSVACFVDAT